jgi:hypothetical protein
LVDDGRVARLLLAAVSDQQQACRAALLLRYVAASGVAIGVLGVVPVSTPDDTPARRGR